MKKTFLLIIVLSAIIMFPNKCKAETNIELKTNNTKINLEEEFTIGITVNGDKISATDLEIYFDSEKLEYISGPNNSNYIDGRILYTWYEENTNEITNFNLGDFTFKPKQNGKTIISIKGNSYDNSGNIRKTNFKELEIQIGEEETKNLINEEEIGTNTDENNAYLKIMRTNQEGIIPNFNKEIFEYYITTNQEINKLEITAIPENNNSKVEIIGNDNFVQGENVVQIKVTSQNGQNTNTYKIYITKTNDLEKANTNLETLAVENTFLYPSFDTTITEYKIEVSKDTENLNILAIPEDEKAKVTIEGNTNIKIGDNPILINVLAEDGVTYRKYKIIAHKRNEEEEQQYEEQEKIEAEELAVILNEKGLEEVVEQNTNENTDNISKTRKNISIIIISLIVIILVIILGIIIKRKINTKKPPI